MVCALGEALQDGHRITASADAPLLSGQDPQGLTLPPLSHHLEELRLPLTVGIFADPLEHAARDGASVR